MSENSLVRLGDCVLTVDFNLKRKGELRGTVIFVLIERPDKAAECILHTVSENKRYGILTVYEIRKNIVKIVRKHLVGVYYIGREPTPV